MKKHLLTTLSHMATTVWLVMSPLAAQSTTCPSNPPVSADNLINMRDFITDNEADVTPAFSCALSFAKGHSLRAIYFPRGGYYFKSAPPPIDFPITIVGDGKGRTVLYRTYSASGANNRLRWHQGLLTFIRGAANSSVKDLGIVASSGSGGTAISLIASPNCASAESCGVAAPDYSLFSNLYLSTVCSSSTPSCGWDYTVYVDGTARITEPYGVRNLDFQNCTVFGAANGAMGLDGVAGFNFIGGGLELAGGASGRLSISPSYTGPDVCSGTFTPTSGLPSWYVNINSTIVAGVHMNASCHGHFSAYFPAAITTSPLSYDNIVIGHVEGGVGSSWLKSTYLDPEN